MKVFDENGVALTRDQVVALLAVPDVQVVLVFHDAQDVEVYRATFDVPSTAIEMDGTWGTASLGTFRYQP